MATFLDLKNEVTNQLGANDGSTPNAIRDNCILQARRQYYSERRWSFVTNVGVQIAITNQFGNLPDDFNLKFDPLDVYVINGGVKFQYRQVPWGFVNAYSPQSFVFAIDKVNKQIQLNTGTMLDITMDYVYLPADWATDGSQDTDTEQAPDITPIATLAVGKWWLASERDTEKYDLFVNQVYPGQLSDAKTADSMGRGVIPFNMRKNRPRTGYVSRF